jgi:hypothetical protein
MAADFDVELAGMRCDRHQKRIIIYSIEQLYRGRQSIATQGDPYQNGQYETHGRPCPPHCCCPRSSRSLDELMNWSFGARVTPFDELLLI